MAEVEDMDVVAPAEEGDEAESPGDEKGPEFEPPQVCPLQESVLLHPSLRSSDSMAKWRSATTGQYCQAGEKGSGGLSASRKGG